MFRAQEGQAVTAEGGQAGEARSCREHIVASSRAGRSLRQTPIYRMHLRDLRLWDRKCNKTGATLGGNH